MAEAFSTREKIASIIPGGKKGRCIKLGFEGTHPPNLVGRLRIHISQFGKEGGRGEKKKNSTNLLLKKGRTHTVALFQEKRGRVGLLPIHRNVRPCQRKHGQNCLASKCGIAHNGKRKKSHGQKPSSMGIGGRTRDKNHLGEESVGSREKKGIGGYGT